MSAGDDVPIRRRGPLDEASWPDKLTARVVRPGPTPAIHGYDVEGDLARHYSFAETVLLTLTGQVPTINEGRAFEVALHFLSPSPVNEAPAHAAVLARICAGSTSSIQATSAIALAEQARSIVAEHGAWIEALSGTIASLPSAYRATSESERTSVERLRRALRGSVDVPALAHDVARSAAVVATLYACGLKSAEQIECAFVFAKLPVAMAEALAAPAAGYREYPVHLPRLEYTENEP